MNRLRPCAPCRLLGFTLAAALVMAGCASGPRPTQAPAADSPVADWPDKDGPEAQPPPGLLDVPDAEPRVEAIRTGGPNKPYEVFGRGYVPVSTDQPFTQRGLASWYGRKFHGRPTASGEIYNMYAMTAAHPTLPIPSYARVRNPANGKEVIVRVNDRGPFHGRRAIDLSYTAALKLGVLRGVAPVHIERLTHDEIRAGSWRRDADATDPVAAIGDAAPAPAQATVEPVSAAAVHGPTLAAAESARAAVPGAVGFWVQLGAFRAHEGAVDLQRRAALEMEALSPLLAIFKEGVLHRLQAGPYERREEANQVAQRLREALRLSPVIVQRR
ncbi:septal ring lytic transglycosylase RlpA family protein [Aquincola sp. MAHUQ-54]|uniref:Endolytic peptidoglycan transglycosylase RlpA n=1 Tax=Aquincola agrisoli TaxID=3119538 RepID=A0AAW9QJW2_9BURK